MDSSERFAAELRAAEDRLRAAGLGGRRAFAALARHLAERLGLSPELWPEGPDAPASAHLESLPLSPELDLFGLAYERFFSDLFKGERGQYFTPRPLIELVADLAAIRPGERVLDPTCGSASFLIAALARGADVDGVEADPDLVALARLNLALHGANPRAVTGADFFALPDDGERWDVVLANPPFSVEISDPAVLGRHPVASGRGRVTSDMLFVEAALARLRPSGRLVTVLPYSVLGGSTWADLRDRIDTLAVREAVISLPEGVFRPFGGTPTRACVVALRKRPAEIRPMLAAVIEHPGFDTRRQAFRRSEPDELVGLRMHLRGAPFANARRVEGAGWVPEEVIRRDGIAGGVPTFRLGDRARVCPRVPVKITSTVIDFADLDKTTGEIVDARPGTGGQALEPGDLLFGRMRPELNNVTIAERPREDLPEPLAGSGEWIRLRTREQAEFHLLAARSSFARAQLVTGGQTRPRTSAEDVADLALPDPGPEARAVLDRHLWAARAERRRLRRKLARIEALYEAFGRGEIDAAALVAGVESS